MSSGRAVVLTFAALSAVAAIACVQDRPAGPASSSPRSSLSPLVVKRLHVEHLDSPLGIDVAKPRFSWIVESSARAQMQGACRVLVSRNSDVTDSGPATLWDSGRVDVGDSLDLEYAGKPLVSHDRLYWKVMVWDQDGRASKWSDAATFSTGFLAPNEWKAQWIGFDEARGLDAASAAKSGAPAAAPTPPPSPPPPRLPPTVLLRSPSFSIKPGLLRATAYASALGLCDLHLNGTRVSDDYFTPGWTDYSKRVYWRAYDVTKLLHAVGDNVLGVELADGWFSGYVGYGHQRDHYGKRPRAAVQLHLDYADGTSDDVVTDAAWQARVGATSEADFLMGERFDAQLAKQLEGWDTPGSATPSPSSPNTQGDWHPVAVGAELHPQLQWHPGPPVRAFTAVEPVSMTQPQSNVWVFDLGQNFAGVAKLALDGEPAGENVQLRFAERLNPDGTIYTTNLRGARATDVYTTRGGAESWTPRFTFHGFQYVEVTGLSKVPAKSTITGIPLSSATPLAGSFDCAESMLNRLWLNAVWTQRANFIDVPTDCPQRDERLGWTGDAQVFCKTATYDTDAQAFYAKWIVDLDDAQRADGEFPMVAPLKVAGDDGGPAWADAGVVVPCTMFEQYGDRRLLGRAYPAMTKFLDFCRKRSTAELLPPEKFHCFGDWLNINDPTPNEVICTAYFARCADLVANAAAALGRTDDVGKWRELARDLKRAFQKAYVAEDGTIRGNSQTAYAMAISFDLLETEQLVKAREHLLAKLHANHDRLSTGFVGTKDLMLSLSRLGEHELAWHLLLERGFPSWGFTIDHGATSIWERWDGWTPEHGFQDPGMNSFAHYAFGAVVQWMVENVGGLQRTGPAWRSLRIAPIPSPDVPWARTRWESPRGTIVSNWQVESGGGDSRDRFVLDVTVPANTTAEVVLPTSDPDSITIDGKPFDAPLTRSPNSPRASISVGSGSYHFTCRR